MGQGHCTTYETAAETRHSELRIALARFQLVKALQCSLIKAIDARLAELAELVPDDRCLVCKCPVAPPTNICWCCDSGCWPPYNEYFRCELMARLSWVACQLLLHPDRKVAPFPADRPASGSGKPLRGALAEIKKRDILEVAAQYSELRPSGSSKYRGLCPLHQEKTPSFYVYLDSQRWRCFGACASGGDVIELLKRLGKLQLRRNPHKPRRITNWEVRG